MAGPHPHRHGRIDRGDHAAAKAGQPDTSGVYRRGRLSVLEKQDSDREPGAAGRCRSTRAASDHGEEIVSFQLTAISSQRFGLSRPARTKTARPAAASTTFHVATVPILGTTRTKAITTAAPTPRAMLRSGETKVENILHFRPGDHLIVGQKGLAECARLDFLVAQPYSLASREAMTGGEVHGIPQRTAGEPSPFRQTRDWMRSASARRGDRTP